MDNILTAAEVEELKKRCEGIAGPYAHAAARLAASHLALGREQEQGYAHIANLLEIIRLLDVGAISKDYATWNNLAHWVTKAKEWAKQNRK